MSKTIVVDPDKCIGCSTCALIDSETFFIDQTDYKAKIKKQPETIGDETKNAIDSCPVGAIVIKE